MASGWSYDTLMGSYSIFYPRYRRLLIGVVVSYFFLFPAGAQERGARHFFLQRALRELSSRTGDVFTLELLVKGEDADFTPAVHMASPSSVHIQVPKRSSTHTSPITNLSGRLGSVQILSHFQLGAYGRLSGCFVSVSRGAY